MKAPKEYRRWVNWMRKQFGKKNGCIDAWFFDNPRMEIKFIKSKKNYRRSQEKNIRD